MNRFFGCLLFAIVSMKCFGEEEKPEKFSKEQIRQFEKNIKEYEAKNDAKSKNIYDKWKSEAYNKDLEKRASSGDIYAIASLGRCYFIGEGVKQDNEKGISLLRKAAEGGFVVAQCNLGSAIIRTELGIQKDDKNISASHAYDESSLDYNKLLLCNKDNLKEAAEWVAKAAHQDYINAQILLAQLYMRGIGVEQNKQEAIKWLKRAADNGSSQAQFKLIQDSIAEHEAKFRARADRGDAEASYEYGMLLLNSQRVKDAKKYLSKAAMKGSEKAIKEIEERNKDVFLLDDAVTLSVKANSESKLKDKMNMHQDALVKLKTIKTQNPKWESAIIDYYIKDAESSIEYENRRLKEEQEQEKEAREDLLKQEKQDSIKGNESSLQKNCDVKSFERSQEEKRWEKRVIGMKAEEVVKHYGKPAYLEGSMLEGILSYEGITIYDTRIYLHEGVAEKVVIKTHGGYLSDSQITRLLNANKIQKSKNQVKEIEEFNSVIYSIDESNKTRAYLIESGSSIVFATERAKEMRPPATGERSNDKTSAITKEFKIGESLQTIRKKRDYEKGTMTAHYSYTNKYETAFWTDGRYSYCPVFINDCLQVIKIIQDAAFSSDQVANILESYRIKSVGDWSKKEDEFIFTTFYLGDGSQLRAYLGSNLNEITVASKWAKDLLRSGIKPNEGKK